MRRLLTLLAATTVTLAATGCQLSDPNGPTAPDILHATYASSLGVDPASMKVTQDGVYYRDDVAGTGTVAKAGLTAYFNYTGWLTSGTTFDTSTGKTQEPSFLLGAAQVIPGFEEGMLGMQVGGTRTMIVPPGLAYGASRVTTQTATIPANSILVFRVTLDSLK